MTHSHPASYLIPLLITTIISCGGSATPSLPSTPEHEKLDNVSLGLPEGCVVAAGGEIAVFRHAGSPFVDTTITANQKTTRVSMVVDTRWNGCSTIDPRAAATLGF